MSGTITVFDLAAGSVVRVLPHANPSRIAISTDGAWLAQWNFLLLGDHMALNSAAAAIMAHWLGAEWEEIEQALATFSVVSSGSE